MSQASIARSGGDLVPREEGVFLSGRSVRIWFFDPFSASRPPVFSKRVSPGQIRFCAYRMSSASFDDLGMPRAAPRARVGRR